MDAGQLLREARRRAGLTQAELASRAGTTQSAIARIERGASSPSFERLRSLIHLCGLELEVRLVPLDDHETTMAEENRLRDATERLRNMLAVAALRRADHGSEASHGG
jgi:transcriptional regulator with XRE-family HTH domain